MVPLQNGDDLKKKGSMLKIKKKLKEQSIKYLVRRLVAEVAQVWR